MDYTAIIAAVMHYASIALAVVFCLTIGVNLIVEVIKGLFPKLPTNILAFIVSIAVTMLAFFIAVSVLGIPILWYYVVAAVILGIFVAYAAMFGFDKFTAAWDKLKQLKDTE